MKVSLKPGTASKGLIFKKEIHTVRVTVQLSEEEKAAVKAAGFLDAVVFNLPVDYKNAIPPIAVTGKDLVKGCSGTGNFVDFLDANQFTQEVKNNLTNLKDALEAKMGEAEEEFEL